MAAPTIALSVCSSTIPNQINNSYDLDRSTSSSTASPSQKPFIGGLSRLFSSPPIKSAYYPTVSDDLTSLWHDKSDAYPSSLKRDNSSPVSVLHGPNPRVSGDFGSVRMFGGFVRHALCSYVENDSVAVEDEELTFDMDDGFVEMELPPYARDLLYEAQERNEVFRDDFVVKAFREAEKAHRGQMRASGHPYLQHCVETAVLLAKIGANSTVIAAGLLHDAVDDSSVTIEDISESFGAGVKDLVEGVSKLSHLSKLARENNTASKTVEADRLHTMFLGMADARAVLIKLADRLHNMMTLDALPLIKQQRFAKETLEIFAPLANRLGISTWKEQLENLCFKYLYPAQHKSLSSKLVDSYEDGLITSSVEKLEQALKDGAVSYHCLSGRHKSLYSIYSKMLKKKLNMNEIHDIHGIRLIVESEKDCYKALEVVQKLWREVPGRFKDYIISPKFNGYQSLHTVVIGDDMVPFEVQIRTKEMHLQAECGFAAHWMYKEGDSKYSSFVLQMVEWARWAITWQCEAMSKDMTSIGFIDSSKQHCKFPIHSGDCSFSCKPHCNSDGPVFVIMIDNDKMSVQEFPPNSSVMDLLVRSGRGSSRWTSYGFPVKEELRPRINHEPVSDPSCKLKMGDVVELTPSIPDKSLIEYRKEIQRMYNRGATKPTVGTMASFRS